MKVRLGQISYANDLPVYWGFREARLPWFLEITEAPPSALNKMLATGMIDISPVSSISYAHHFKEWLIVPEFSIASRGRVMSVLLLSRVPLEQLTGRRIMVSEESETSMELLRLCLRRSHVFPRIEQRKISPAMLDDESICGILAIGDTALQWDNEIRTLHKTDLGLSWKQWTGKPFVFAVWAVRRQFAEQEPELVSKTISALAKSRNEGLASLSVISEQVHRQLGINKDVMETYFRGLSYGLNKENEQGLRLFFRLSWERGYLREPVSLEYFAEG